MSGLSVQTAAGWKHAAGAQGAGPCIYLREAPAPAQAEAGQRRDLQRRTILLGDVLDQLRRLPDDSIDCVVTSPPYFLLRNYGHRKQIGLESVVGEWVDRLVAVADEIARVLRPSGCFWLNLGDSYSRHRRFGAHPKGLLLGPERVLLALADRGWMVRNKIVWAKPNPMPASARDRLTCTWEPLYLLVRGPSYYFDLDAIRVPHRTRRRPQQRPSRGTKYSTTRPGWAGPLAGANDGLLRARAEGRVGHPLGKNPGDVWTVPTASFRGAHFATFPQRLIERPLLATCPQRVCASCGTAWRRPGGGLRPQCACRADWRAGIVLDPFIGSGTVAVVAERLERDWLGIELNPDYRDLALERITAARRDSTSTDHEEVPSRT